MSKIIDKIRENFVEKAILKDEGTLETFDFTVPGKNHEIDVSAWCFRHGDSIQGEAIVKFSKGRIVIDKDSEKIPFAEFTKPVHPVKVSETDRSLIEAIPSKGIELAMGNESDEIQGFLDNLETEIIAEFSFDNLSYNKNALLI